MKAQKTSAAMQQFLETFCLKSDAAHITNDAITAVAAKGAMPVCVTKRNFANDVATMSMTSCGRRHLAAQEFEDFIQRIKTGAKNASEFSVIWLAKLANTAYLKPCNREMRKSLSHKLV